MRHPAHLLHPLLIAPPLTPLLLHHHRHAHSFLLLTPPDLPPPAPEQLVHRLHAPALALRERQPHPHDTRARARREQRERAPRLHGDRHVREEARDEEVQHVLVAERHRHDGAAGARGADLARCEGEDGGPAEAVAFGGE